MGWGWGYRMREKSHSSSMATSAGAIETEKCSQYARDRTCQGSGFRVWGSGFRVQGSGCRVQGSRFRVQGSGLIGAMETAKCSQYASARTCNGNHQQARSILLS